MDSLAGKRLLILGLARQGKALARFAVSAGAMVTVSDLRPAEKLAAAQAELADLPLRYVLGAHPESLLDETDILAISGGVPADAPFVALARRRGITITNDSQELLRRAPAPVIGITGSAGKSTTTALTGAMGEAEGRRTWVGGNIGRPLITHLADMSATDVVVQELSSFQLEIWQQSPAVAAILNVTPNHLDRHRTMAVYAAAKANIVRHQTAVDVAVFSAEDEGALALVEHAPGRVRFFNRQAAVDDGAFVRQDSIWLRDGNQEKMVAPVASIKLRGRHNLSNVLAACTLADSVGISTQAMATAMATFAGVEHRMELVKVIDGVSYINDSIATAPERALAALHAYDEPLILLAGGRDKDLDWSAWSRIARARTKAVVLFGQLAPHLQSCLAVGAGEGGQGESPLQDQMAEGQVVVVSTMAQAVATAAEIAQPGDVVLLSPGGTSFGAYVDFAARGRHFRELVHELESASTVMSQLV